jgi:hypothetical protein
MVALRPLQQYPGMEISVVLVFLPPLFCAEADIQHTTAAKNIIKAFFIAMMFFPITQFV